MSDIAEVEKLINAGKLQEAKSLVTNISGSQALYFLGLIAFKQDQYDLAIGYLQKAVDEDKTAVHYYEILGQAYGLKAQQSGPVKGAMLLPKVKRAFLKALELNPDALEAQKGLFMFYLFSPSVAGGDKQKALDIANNLMEHNPAHGHLLLALYAVKNKETVQAENHFNAAFQHGGDDAEIVQRVSRYFLENENIPKAEQAVRQLMQLRQDDIASLVAMGDLMRLKKDFKNANIWYKKALDKNDNFFPARLKMAKNFIQAGQKDEAVSIYKHILEHNAKSPAAAIARGALKSL